MLFRFGAGIAWPATHAELWSVFNACSPVGTKRLISVRSAVRQHASDIFVSKGRNRRVKKGLWGRQRLEIHLLSAVELLSARRLQARVSVCPGGVGWLRTAPAAGRTGVHRSCLSLTYSNCLESEVVAFPFPSRTPLCTRPFSGWPWPYCSSMKSTSTRQGLHCSSRTCTPWIASVSSMIR